MDILYSFHFNSALLFILLYYFLFLVFVGLITWPLSFFLLDFSVLLYFSIPTTVTFPFFFFYNFILLFEKESE